MPHDVSVHSRQNEATHQRKPELLIIDGEDDNYVPCKDTLGNEDDECAR